MNNKNASSSELGFHGGLLAALVAFALTWFVVNGAELSQDASGALDTVDMPICALPADKPTSRFLNAPVAAPMPWYGG